MKNNQTPTTEKKLSILSIAKNKRARFEYTVIESIEAGLSLCGSEVKSLKLGNVNLSDAFCFAANGEVFLKNCNITPYEKGSYFNLDPRRDRKLLLHRKEILRLVSKVKEKSLTLVPLSLYFKGRYVKLELGLCQGKKLYDKKETIKRRDIERDVARQIKDASTK